MKVPKLEAGGTNWVIYKDRLLQSINARGLLDHVDGSREEPKCPVRPKFASKKDVDGHDTGEMEQVPYTSEEESKIKEWKENLQEWKQGEAIVKQQLATTISDSLSS